MYFWPKKIFFRGGVEEFVALCSLLFLCREAVYPAVEQNRRCRSSRHNPNQRAGLSGPTRYLFSLLGHSQVDLPHSPFSVHVYVFLIFSAR